MTDPPTRPRAGWLLLGVVTLVNVLALPREQYIGDPVAIRLETVQLLRTGVLGVPAEIGARMGQRGQYFFENRARGRWFSKYGLLNTLMYVPPLLAERLVTGSLPLVSPRRLAFLNAFNLLLALAAGAYLVATVSLYTSGDALKWVYVLSAFYATFWWNYVRAQAPEIYQTLFFIAFYYHLARHLRGEGRRHLLLSTPYMSGLCLTKLSFLVLVPAVAVVLLAADREASRGRPPERARGLAAGLRPIVVGFVLPVAGLAVVLGLVSAYKFGSPLLTGYEQMVEERDLLGGDLLTGLYGFTLSAQGSMLLHFPLLLFALAGYPAFFRKRPAETAAIVTFTVALLLVNSRFKNWQGAAAYGPRYMLPVLPIASLPFLEVLGWIRERRRPAAGALAAAVIALVLASSVLLQHYVNALPFFAFHFARNAVFVEDDGPEAQAFFGRPLGIVDRDLVRYWKGAAPLAVLEREKTRADPAAYASMRQGIAGVLRSNYLWFDIGPATPPRSSSSSTARRARPG